MRKEWRKFLQFILTVFLILVVFGFGTRIVNAEENREAAQSSEEDAEEDTGRIQQKVEDALLSEFDFDEIEDSLRRMFPREKISFSEVVSELMSGDIAGVGKIFVEYLSDQIFYEFRYNRENLVYMLLVALTAAVFTNFAGAFQNRQVSEISFYILYMLLITLCLTAFRIATQGLEEQLDSLLDFMRVLCPSYFLAVA
ncbi:MAG TPA: stage III sporulation protein AE, partial [Candidatus Mediterraneibacter stercoravium]|nr:stage III sporulation protein AE [Candidatus Mediterraneibacter stercoravium]